MSNIEEKHNYKVG